MVELLRRYSNRPDLLGPLTATWAKIKSETTSDDGDLVTVDARPPRIWRVADRLSDTDMAALLEAYRVGESTRSIAARYGLGTTTVKRLLREYGVRR